MDLKEVNIENILPGFLKNISNIDSNNIFTKLFLYTKEALEFVKDKDLKEAKNIVYSLLLHTNLKEDEKQFLLEKFIPISFEGIIEGLEMMNKVSAVIDVVKEAKSKGLFSWLSCCRGTDVDTNVTGNSLPIKTDVESNGNFSSNTISGNEIVLVKIGGTNA